MALQLELWKKKRKELNLKYEDLAQRAQVSLNTVKNIFRGATTDPRLETVQAIESALGLTSNKLPWTEKEKASGVVHNHKESLSADEVELLDAYRAIKSEKGEPAAHAMKTLMKAYLNEKK